MGIEAFEQRRKKALETFAEMSKLIEKQDERCNVLQAEHRNLARDVQTRIEHGVLDSAEGQRELDARGAGSLTHGWPVSKTR